MRINFANIPHYIRREIDAPRQILSKGSRSLAVKRVQEWLCYHRCRTRIDGKYGPATGACVGSFQDQTGLASSGTVTKDT